jgi:hypothetical protein
MLQEDLESAEQRGVEGQAIAGQRGRRESSISQYQSVIRNQSGPQQWERTLTWNSRMGRAAGREGRDLDVDDATFGSAYGRARLLGQGAGHVNYGFGGGSDGGGPAGGPVGGEAAGLASLQVEIPVRGQVFYFTTPRGDVEVTARAVSRRSLDNVRYLVIALVVAALAVIAYRVVGREGFAVSRGRMLARAAVIAGTICIVIGFLPILGVVLALAGIAASIRNRRAAPARV